MSTGNMYCHDRKQQTDHVKLCEIRRILCNGSIIVDVVGCGNKSFRERRRDNSKVQSTHVRVLF